VGNAEMVKREEGKNSALDFSLYRVKS